MYLVAPLGRALAAALVLYLSIAVCVPVSRGSNVAKYHPFGLAKSYFMRNAFEGPVVRHSRSNHFHVFSYPMPARGTIVRPPTEAPDHQHPGEMAGVASLHLGLIVSHHLSLPMGPSPPDIRYERASGLSPPRPCLAPMGLA